MGISVDFFEALGEVEQPKAKNSKELKSMMIFIFIQAV